MGALNLWKALYEPGDLVWIFAEQGIFPGEIISLCKGPNGSDVRPKNGKGYLHYTGHYSVSAPKWRLAKSDVHGVAKLGGLFVRSTQIIPREYWERTPLERIRKIIAAHDLRDKYSAGLLAPVDEGEGLRESATTDIDWLRDGLYKTDAGNTDNE